MNETQILTIAMALIIPSVAVISLNRRLNDIEKRLVERIDNGFAHLEMLLKNHKK